MRRPVALILLGLLTVPAAAASPSPTPDPDDPIRVVVTDIAPKAPRPGGTFEVKGTLVNIGSHAITDLRVRLQVGDRVSTRSDLDAADLDRPPTSLRVSVHLTGVLEPGQTMAFGVPTQVRELRLGRLGVYPLDVVARGNAGDGLDSLGLAPTWIPWFGPETPRPTRVAVLWPLVDVPHLRPDGTLGDDALTGSLSDHGRLGRLVAVARAAQARVCEPGVVPARCEAVPVTFGIDPDLLDTVQAMSRPYRVSAAGVSRPGTGTALANSWLTQLRAVGLVGRVLALPYADPDASALSRDARGKDDLINATALGTEVTTAVLGVSPLTQVAWPPPGAVTPAAANALAQSGARAFVLDPSAYDDNGVTPDVTPAALSSFTTSATGVDLDGLVVDPDLSDLLAGTSPYGYQVAEQRFLAETAIVAAQQPSVSRTLVLALPRRGDVSVGGATNVLRDLGRVPWLCPVTVADAATGSALCAGQVAGRTVEPVVRGTPRTDNVDELPSGYLRQVAKDRDTAVQLTDAVLSAEPVAREQVAALKASLRRAIARAESSAGRDQPDTAQTTSQWLHDQVTGLVGDVVVRGGRSLLTSTKGTLSVNIENTLRVAIQVRVRFTSKTATLSNAETGLVTVEPAHAVQASVRAAAQRSGQFVVFAQIVDRNGKPFGAETEIIVRSTRFGRLALAVTIGAAAVLMVAAAVRITRRALGRP
jgi:hypothetical protein